MIRGVLAFLIGMALAVATAVAVTVAFGLAEPGGPFAATEIWKPEEEPAEQDVAAPALSAGAQPARTQSAKAVPSTGAPPLRIPPAVVIPKVVGPPSGGAIIREGGLGAPASGVYAGRLDVPMPPNDQIHVVAPGGSGGRANLSDLTDYANRAARRQSSGSYQDGMQVVAIDSLSKRESGHKAKEYGKGPAPVSSHHILVIQNPAGLFEEVRLQDGRWEDVTQSRKCYEALRNAKSMHRVEAWMLKACGVTDVRYAPRGTGQTVLQSVATRQPKPVSTTVTNSVAAADPFGLNKTITDIKALPHYRAPIPTPTPKPKRGKSYSGEAVPKQATEPGMWSGSWTDGGDTGSWLETN